MLWCRQIEKTYSNTSTLEKSRTNAARWKIWNYDPLTSAGCYRILKVRVQRQCTMRLSHCKNGNLRVHLKTHSKEKSNKCNQCSFTTSMAQYLKKHSKIHIHSEDKSNRCNQCSYSTSEAGYLRKHLKTHDGKKSNKCNLCDFASSWAGNLKMHMKRHSGKNLNKCNQCNFSSHVVGDLRKHLKRRHWQRKAKQMQPILSRQFKDTFENTDKNDWPMQNGQTRKS